ncbi:MAG: hypothetical protein GY791_09055 [Alphaproteobacteria bacterium]|nr:hypothetical protein [Alphaproteobacteria bacterium]
MTTTLDRDALLAGAQSLDGQASIDAGRRLAEAAAVGRCPFLDHYRVASEAGFKRRAIADGTITLHAQFGFRDPDKSRRAWAEIHAALDRAGHTVHRYGICLDWSMGYPAARRDALGRGTGLVLDGPDEFARLTAAAPVAPHFGDFVIGLPAAVENTVAALHAGATTIGNLGQYFTFRMPNWPEDVDTTTATVTAIALIGAQPVECLVHSNLDDGFAALFTDLACSLGAVLIERYIVEDLIGAQVTHCYGNTFADGPKRLAFLLALNQIGGAPGSMVYGNTTSYGANEDENWANLAAYFLVDVLGQRIAPTGHALNPVPVTEAQRIPDIDEIIAVHMAANRLIERAEHLQPPIDTAAARAAADAIVAGGERFRDNVLAGLAESAIDITNPAELLLAIRRIGAAQLERLFGPGRLDATCRRGRQPVVQAPSIADIERDGSGRIERLDPALRDRLTASRLTGVVVSTDVHEYGKILIDTVLAKVGVTVVDGGTHGDIGAIVESARAGGADFVAVSTYNGVALTYLTALREAMAGAGFDIPIYVGGKLNQVPDGSNTSLPVDVSAALAERGAIVCSQPEDMLLHLDRLSGDRVNRELKRK